MLCHHFAPPSPEIQRAHRHEKRTSDGSKPSAMGPLPSPRCSRSLCRCPAYPRSPHTLAASAGEKWPTTLTFLLRFVTLLIAWFYHHRLLQWAELVGTRLLFTTGLLLLIISTVPFPTALSGAPVITSTASAACAVYAGYIGVLNFMYNLSMSWVWTMWAPSRYSSRSETRRRG